MKITINTNLNLKEILSILDMAIRDKISSLPTDNTPALQFESLRTDGEQIAKLSHLANDFENLIFEQKNTKNELQ